MLTGAGVSQAAQPFFAALLRNIFPRRPMVVVTDNLKTQESFQQDLETWLSSGRESRVEGREQNGPGPRPSTFDLRPFFYPAWDGLPHEGKLPHADTISDRLQTLVALNQNFSEGGTPRRPNFRLVELAPPKVPIVVTSVTALLQKTFAPDDLKNNTRTLARGDKINLLDLIEWLEEQGCEPEAQVTQKGEIALRGGILDVWPLISPWPVRLEFFGDELESLRHFDPLTQISREEILSVTLPPAGELGLLKRWQETGGSSVTRHLSPAIWWTICHRRQFFSSANRSKRRRADEYAQLIPENDPFFISWPNLLAQLDRKAMTRLEVSDADVGVQAQLPGEQAEA